MTKPEDIAEIAADLTSRHGARAIEVATKHAQAMLDEDDVGGALVWLEVARAILGRPREQSEETRH